MKNLLAKSPLRRSFSEASQPVVTIPDISITDAYVKASIVAAKNGRKCVDGRYLPDQATGMLARPGGDGGYVMALMAVNRKKNLGLTPEQCFNAVYKVVANDSGFCMHTDQHADPISGNHVGLIGCGHLAKAASRRFCNEYDVNSDDVEKLITYARNIHEISPTVKMVNLAGEHQERGVLIVESNAYTILADNPELKQMYFVYDEQRDNAFIQHLVDELGIAGVTYEDIKFESDLQLHATLQILAVNLPIYKITFAGKVPKVTFAGLVEPKVQTKRTQILKRFAFPKLQHFAHKFSKN